MGRERDFTAQHGGSVRRVEGRKCRSGFASPQEARALFGALGWSASQARALGFPRTQGAPRRPPGYEGRVALGYDVSALQAASWWRWGWGLGAGSLERGEEGSRMLPERPAPGSRSHLGRGFRRRGRPLEARNHFPRPESSPGLTGNPILSRPAFARRSPSGLS